MMQGTMKYLNILKCFWLVSCYLLLLFSWLEPRGLGCTAKATNFPCSLIFVMFHVACSSMFV